MMDFLIANALSLLYLSLAFMAVGITLFLIPVLIQVASLLRKVNKLTAEINDTVELIQSYLWQPARFFLSLKSGIGNIADFLKRFVKQK